MNDWQSGGFDGLNEAVKEDPSVFNFLTEEQQDVLKSTFTKCPVCKSEFPLYDRRQARIRRHCSRTCSNKARIKKKWVCVLCERRFGNPKALKQHRMIVHPNCTDAAYLEKWFVYKGVDPASVNRFCPKCSASLRINNTCSGFDQCPCIRQRNKIAIRRGELEKCSDPKIRQHLGQSIGGSQRRLSQITKAVTPISQRRQEAIMEKTIQKRIEEMESKSMARQILVGAGALFRAYLDQNAGVYDAYDSLVRAILERKSTYSQRMANERLLEEIKRHAWKRSPGNAASCLYILTLGPGELRNDKAHWIEYVKPIDYGFQEYGRLQDSITYDESAVVNHINKHDQHFQHAFPSNNYWQCWYRFMLCRSDGIQYPPNPWTMTMVYETSDKTVVRLRSG